MPAKNSLNAYKKTSAQPRILKMAEEEKNSAKRGRKPKNTAEKESEVVALKFTPAEKMALEKRAGITPIATYLKHFLRTQTDIFS